MLLISVVCLGVTACEPDSNDGGGTVDCSKIAELPAGWNLSARTLESSGTLLLDAATIENNCGSPADQQCEAQEFDLISIDVPAQLLAPGEVDIDDGSTAASLHCTACAPIANSGAATRGKVVFEEVSDDRVVGCVQVDDDKGYECPSFRFDVELCP